MLTFNPGGRGKEKTKKRGKKKSTPYQQQYQTKPPLVKSMSTFTLHQYLLPSPQALFPGNSYMLTSFTLLIHCRLSSALTCNLLSFCKTCLTYSPCMLATTFCTFFDTCLSKNNPFKTHLGLLAHTSFNSVFHLLHPRTLS